MFARVSTIQGRPDKVAEGVRKLEESLPALRSMDGFKDIYFLVDHKTGKTVVVALWESEQALQAASNSVLSIRDDVNKESGGTGRPTVEVFEVALGPGHMMRKAA